MKCLYLSIVDLARGDGYDRKLAGQVSAFVSYGWLLDVICFRDGGVVIGRAADGPELEWRPYNREKAGNIVLRRFSLFWAAVLQVSRGKHELMFLRYPRADLIAAVFLALFRLISPRTRLIYEIPTYPFDAEHRKPAGLKDRLLYWGERLFRPVVTRLVTAYAVVAHEGPAFGRRSIRIENGVESGPVATSQLPSTGEAPTIELVFVANFGATNHRHGLDRLLKGMEAYAQSGNHLGSIRLHLVGDVPASGSDLRGLLQRPLIAPRVEIHGRMRFEELLQLYCRMHVGIGCLGFHRIGVTHTSALKEREYLAVGLPIVSSSLDYCFGDGFPFRLKVPDDDTDIDVAAIIRFVRECYAHPQVHQVIVAEALREANWPAVMGGIRTFAGK